MPVVPANGIELCYEEQGEGEPLVLIMGLGAQLVYWADGFVTALAGEGFRVVRFDNRDVGLSTKLDGAHVPPLRTMLLRRALGLPLAVPYTLLDMADDVAGLLDVLGLADAHVLGVSMGGMVAQCFAIAHPHRLRSLTSIMSHPGELRFMIGSPRAMAALLDPPPASRQQAIERAEEFYRIVGGKGFALDVAAVRARAARSHDRCFYPPGFGRQMAAILASGSRTAALGFVRTGALVVHGSDDPLVRPAGGRATARAMASARLELIDGMGHDLPEGAWPRIVAAVATLARRACPPLSPGRRPARSRP